MLKNKIFIEKARIFLLKRFLAGRFSENNAIIVTSSPRSGSTWLGNILSLIEKSCVLFEPLQLNSVPEAKKAGFSWRTYVHPECQWQEGELYLKRVFEGRVINSWTAREMSLWKAIQAKTIIVKFVRANRLFPWMIKRFNFRLSILLIRHPCAVIASQLKSLDWKNTERPIEPLYLDKYPLFKEALNETLCVEEYLAANWALDQIPLLLESRHKDNFIIITYEELFLYPERTICKIFQKCGMEIKANSIKRKIAEPSSTVSVNIEGIVGWKNRLTETQIIKIIKTVNKFGIKFYSVDAYPDLNILNSKELFSNIQSHGMKK